MRATFRRAHEREESHGRLLAFGGELGRAAIATWQNEAFDTLTAWGDLDQFRADPGYSGSVVCKTPPEDGAAPRWARLPEDEALLLDHGLSDRDREVAATARESNAHSLGIRELAPHESPADRLED